MEKWKCRKINNAGKYLKENKDKKLPNEEKLKLPNMKIK